MSSGEVLRLATADDAALIWEWRNDPTSREFSSNPAPVPWEAHRRWFAELIVDDARGGWVYESGGEAVAFVRVDTEGEVGTIECTVAPTARGQGYGSRALRFAAQDACRLWDLVEVHAHVRADNVAGEHALLRAGFVADGLVLYRGVKALQYAWRPIRRVGVPTLD